MGETDLLRRYPLGPREFDRIRGFVEGNLGIRLPDSKKVMVESRLQKHLTLLGVPDFGAYCKRLFDNHPPREELQFFIDLITTNKTDFFREPGHFEYLKREILPQFMGTAPAAGSPPFKVWSAGCSSGEEPYTLAMVLEEFKRDAQALEYQIMASDISEKVLNQARSGVYDQERIATLPPALKGRYFLKAKKAGDTRVRMKPEFRSKIRYYRVNFMDKSYPVPTGLHAIFFRNVMIYFEKPTQREIIGRLCSHLKPGGYLFLGHSESLTGIDVPLKNVSATVYRKEA